MEKDKGKMFEFDPVIYPGRLWVSIDPSFDDIAKDFYLLDDNDEVCDELVVRSLYDKHAGSVATTFTVVHKESCWKGCLVAIWQKRNSGVGVCSHEATHVYDYFAQELGLECQGFSNSEPKAYFVQWVANCIYDVVKGKAGK